MPSLSASTSAPTAPTDFYDDMFRLTSYRTDPQLCEQLVTRSYPTMQWLASKGARFLPRLTHAFESGGRFKFSGGVVTELSGGGEGIIQRYTELARKSGVAVRYGARVAALIHDGVAVNGVRVRERRSSPRGEGRQRRPRLRRL